MFSREEFDELTERAVSDVAALLDAGRILQKTRIAHLLRLDTDEEGRAACTAILGLQLSNQLAFDFLHGATTLGRVEEQVLSDRERLVAECHSVPMKASWASIEFAQSTV